MWVAAIDPILATWHSTAAIVADVIYSANPVGETGFLEGGRGGVGELVADTCEGDCSTLSRRLAFRGENGRFVTVVTLSDVVYAMFDLPFIRAGSRRFTVGGSEECGAFGVATPARRVLASTRALADEFVRVAFSTASSSVALIHFAAIGTEDASFMRAQRSTVLSLSLPPKNGRYKEATHRARCNVVWPKQKGPKVLFSRVKLSHKVCEVC